MGEWAGPVPGGIPGVGPTFSLSFPHPIDPEPLSGEEGGP